MKRKKSNRIQNYTDSDLQSFAKLGDFSNFNVVSNDTKIMKKFINQLIILSLTKNNLRNL